MNLPVISSDRRLSSGSTKNHIIQHLKQNSYLRDGRYIFWRAYRGFIFIRVSWLLLIPVTLIRGFVQGLMIPVLKRATLNLCFHVFQTCSCEISTHVSIKTSIQHLVTSAPRFLIPPSWQRFPFNQIAQKTDGKNDLWNLKDWRETDCSDNFQIHCNFARSFSVLE